MKDGKSTINLDIEKPNMFPATRIGPLMHSKKQEEDLKDAIDEIEGEQPTDPTPPDQGNNGGDELDDYFN